MRGYFEVGIFHGKTPQNIGTLWRSAYQLGACGLFTIGARYSLQASDTVKALRNIPVRNFIDFEDFQAARPQGSILVGVEMGGRSLSTFCHPEQAIYLLGAEDHGLPPEIVRQCQFVVSLEAVRQPSYNVAVAGSLVLYHRIFGAS